VSGTGDPVKQGTGTVLRLQPGAGLRPEGIAHRRDAGEQSAGNADPVAREGARRLAEAARERLRNWKVAGAAGSQNALVTFSSPATGVVLEKKAIEGGCVSWPERSSVRIADLSTVWIIADVYEQDLARVKLGESAQVIARGLPGRSFEAKVTYLYPTLNAATRAAPGRLELDKPRGMLRPGMFAHVEIATAAGLHA
jgi:Cu(I)/Ag(I) efflux system membrane fusion protein